MPRVKKASLPPELLELILGTIFGTNQIEEVGYFDLKTLQQSLAVEKYLQAGLGDELRKYMYVNYCRALRKENEPGLDEQKLLVILRSVFKHYGYPIVSKYYKANFITNVKYYIMVDDNK